MEAGHAYPVQGPGGIAGAKTLCRFGVIDFVELSLFARERQALAADQAAKAVSAPWINGAVGPRRWLPRRAREDNTRRFW